MKKLLILMLLASVASAQVTIKMKVDTIDSHKQSVTTFLKPIASPTITAILDSLLNKYTKAETNSLLALKQNSIANLADTSKYAKKDEANTFTATQRFDGVIDARNQIRNNATNGALDFRTNGSGTYDFGYNTSGTGAFNWYGGGTTSAFSIGTTGIITQATWNATNIDSSKLNHVWKKADSSTIASKSFVSNEYVRKGTTTSADSSLFITLTRLGDSTAAIRADFPVGGSTDTTSLSNRIDVKVSKADSATHPGYATLSALAAKASTSSLGSAAYMDSTRVMTLDKTQKVKGSKSFANIVTLGSIVDSIPGIIRLVDTARGDGALAYIRTLDLGATSTNFWLGNNNGARLNDTLATTASTQTFTGTNTFTQIFTAENEIISKGVHALLRLDDQGNSGNYYTLYHYNGYLNFYKNGNTRFWLDTLGNAKFFGDLVNVGDDTVATLQDVRDLASQPTDSSFVEITVDSLKANTGTTIHLGDTLEAGGYLAINGTPLFNASAQPLFIVDTLALDVDGVYEAMVARRLGGGGLAWSDTVDVLATKSDLDGLGAGELAWSDTVDVLATKSDLEGISGGSVYAGYGITVSNDSVAVDSANFTMVGINPSANKIAVWKNSTDSLGNGGTGTIDSLVTTGGATITGNLTVSGSINTDPPWTYIWRTADSSNNTRTTGTPMFHFNMQASSMYEIEATIFDSTAATTTGLVTYASASGSVASGTINIIGNRAAAIGTDAIYTSILVLYANRTADSCINTATGTTAAEVTRVRGLIVTDANARQFTYGWKSEIAGSAVTIRKNSYLRYRKLPY